MLKDHVVVFIGYATSDSLITVTVPQARIADSSSAGQGYRLLGPKGLYVDAQQGLPLRDATVYLGSLGRPQKSLSVRFSETNSPAHQQLWDVRRQLIMTPKGMFERIETGKSWRPYEFSWHAKGAHYRKILTPLNPALFGLTYQHGLLTITPPPYTVRFVGEAPDGTIVCITTAGNDASSTSIYIGARQSGVGRRQTSVDPLVLQPDQHTYMVYVGAQRIYLFVRPEAGLRRNLPRSLRSAYPKTGLYGSYGSDVLTVMDSEFITGFNATGSEVYWIGEAK